MNSSLLLCAEHSVRHLEGQRRPLPLKCTQLCKRQTEKLHERDAMIDDVERRQKHPHDVKESVHEKVVLTDN